MRMDEMNKAFEDRGFEVTRNYLSDRKTYVFTIVRGDNILSGEFKYEPSIDYSSAHLRQEEFITHLIRTFYKKYYCHVVDYGDWKEDPIKKVIFNDPATIILWNDGTKTVVKCSENDTYSPEMGMAMAICKKALGNKGNYSKVFKKWLPEEEESIDLSTMLRFINDHLQKALYRVFGATGENCQQVVEKKVRVINDIEHLSGMDLEMLREKLAAGYTLTPPEEKGSVVTFGLPVEDYNVGEQTEAFEKAGWTNG